MVNYTHDCILRGKTFFIDSLELNSSAPCALVANYSLEQGLNEWDFPFSERTKKNPTLVGL